MRIPLILVTTTSTILHVAVGNIQPLFPGRIDASGLGPGLDFFNFETLEIQLYANTPTWIVRNLNSTETHFVGETADGFVRCDLMRYISTTTSGQEEFSVLNGRCHDSQRNRWYEIKPDDQGKDTVELEFGRPSAAEGLQLGEPLYLSWRDLIKAYNPATLLRDYLASLWSFQIDTFSSFLRGDTNDITRIDVMLIWSENSECARSGLGVDCQLTEQTRANMEGAVRAIVLDTNVVHTNSNAGVEFHLVHMQRDDSGYRETSSTQTLTDLAVPLFDGNLNYIQKLRNKYKADLVTFVLDIRLDDERIGGMALGVNIAGFPFPSVPLPCLGYDVISSQRMFDQDFVPAHEWGHVLGCSHDRGTVSGGDFGGGVLGGDFACNDITDTAYGYRSPSGSFRTVMAYPCEPGQCDNYQGNGPCYAIPYWSGDANYRNGESLGGEDNRCRDEIRKNRKAISRYR